MTKVAAYSFIFLFAKITRHLIWMKNGAWIDQNWQKLQSLCLQEAVDAEVEKPFVEAVLKEVSSNEVKFQIKSNSQYVFQYMLTQSIKKDIKKK